MAASSSFLEQAWDGILSRDRERILNTFHSLDAESQKTVFNHLNRMASEEGWHPEQVKSAQCALKVIEGDMA
ncbi:MAG: hypothetical protein KBF64_00920 [Anaerolineaceae bacterium]|nr:hypothetical protein [Anaerolineaceae bacterium]